jgi:hypothetical protein
MSSEWDWKRVDNVPRHLFASLERTALPDAPGVYAFYRDGDRVYVGKATRQTVQDRVWKCHRGRGKSMGNSALRRNVAEMLGIASARAIKTGAHAISDDEVQRVNSWLDACELACVALDSAASATAVEDALKAEFMPPLTKQ